MAQREAPRPPEGAGAILGDIVEAAAESAGASGAPGTAMPRRDSAIGRLLLGRGRTRFLFILLASFGPGLIAANAGNDAGGIATYATTGATYGYSLLWVFPLIIVALAVVQEMAARMGAATGKGLSDLIRENFSIHITALVMLALFIANALTVITEFLGISASVDLVVPNGRYLVLPIAAIIWLMVVRSDYSLVEKIFLAMTLVFFAYPVSAFLAGPNWGDAARSTAIPTFHGTIGYLLTIAALIGTSITPYMQVYVQSAIAEKGVTAKDYLPEKIGVYVGSLFAMLVAAFIVIATAAKLYPNPNITTAAQAAQALAPLAGPAAKYLFAVGLFGASMLAAAVLPLATAYSVTEALGVESGQSQSFRRAPIFMSLFTGLIAIGAIIAAFIPVSVIKVLFITQVIDALLLPFVLFPIVRLAGDRRIMGDLVNGPIYTTIARVAAVIISVLALAVMVGSVGQAVGWGF